MDEVSDEQKPVRHLLQYLLNRLNVVVCYVKTEEFASLDRVVVSMTIEVSLVTSILPKLW